MSHLHVALVTGRPEANLIPLLQLKPDTIYLVTSQRMTQAAERLHKLLVEELPAHTNIQIHSGLPDTDPQAISHYAIGLAEQLDQYKDATEKLTITYDMTGGTKLMALLFQEAMRCCGAEMLYVDSDAGMLYHMDRDLKPESFRSEAIESVLDADLYLRANGKKRGKTLSDDDEWRKRAQERKSLTKYLAQRADELTKLFGQLNYLIHIGREGSAPVITRGKRQDGSKLNEAGCTQWLKKSPNKTWKNALHKMDEAQVLEWSPENPEQLLFPSAEGALYLGGGWLEEYAWHCAQDAGLEDVHCGAHIIDESGRKSDVRNELDCLAVYRNRMLIIECKTARMDEGERDQQVLHKLHSLADQSAGLYGTQVLLTSQQFGSDKFRDTNLKRAQGMRVRIVEGANLESLSNSIKGWIETGRWRS